MQFQWPYVWMFAATAALASAIVLPWLPPFHKRGFFFILVPAIVATLLWRAYEYRLHQMAPVGDPLIRIDLLLWIFPLLAIAWLSTLAAGASSLFKDDHRQNQAASRLAPTREFDQEIRSQYGITSHE